MALIYFSLYYTYSLCYHFYTLQCYVLMSCSILLLSTRRSPSIFLMSTELLSYYHLFGSLVWFRMILISHRLSLACILFCFGRQSLGLYLAYLTVKVLGTVLLWHWLVLCRQFHL